MNSIVLPGPSSIKTYPLRGVAGTNFLSHWSGPAHQSSSRGTPFLSVALMPQVEHRQALFNFGNGWKDRLCSDDKAIYVTPPNTPHEWRFEGSVMVIMLSISMRQIDGVLEELEISSSALDLVKPLAEKGYSDPLVHDLVLRLWTSSRTDIGCNPLFVQSAIVCILHSIAAKCYEVAGGATRQIAGYDLKAVLDMIEDRLDESLSLSAMADLARVSKFHFIRLFSEETGRTPYQYIQHRRIEKARLLLKTTDRTVADIGATVGFPDPPNFSRTFTRHVGLSPTQYRFQGR
ncbi:AraC family transcriptional regulator [Curvibacter sp. HBC61]|uniref:AraC family transcriptional regulator n=1 Tax=Curvibacter cyanobacteriorum TaxID=3026422 RepID=A0ABT5MY62_9BURK|nr:AraC family transcriptional regulator [Curvibacter sp. HBC61]MDD0838757.1 AraC family transcriptional regulator [Curvibacter sp. HBC61]